MPTKTDRILSYLPGTFRALPKPTALHAVADAFGNQLLLAENSLAAIMLSHWVDHADRGAEEINDLAKIAALYGLAPRRDPLTDEVLESAEEFRDHLKRYIRTFLEGTATVPGLLRVTAEALGLRIDDAHLDGWWTRTSLELVTQQRQSDDAAELVLGVRSITVTGSPATAAQFQGQVDLSAGVDLRGSDRLRLQVNGDDPIEISLVGAGVDPALVAATDIRDAINAAVGQIIAEIAANRLILTSPTTGATSRLEIAEIPNDASERILGLRPRTYIGTAAYAARFVSPIDLSAGVELDAARYIRIGIDSTHLAEIDCAAGQPGLKTLDQVCTAINEALGITVASHDSQHLILTSPTIGASSSIAFQSPAAQDATALLFGAVNAFYLGQDDQPARVTGNQDLRQGVDLSQDASLSLQLDATTSVTVNCAGEDPAHTAAAEIVAAINTAFNRTLASFDGRFISLTSPTTGSASTIAFEPVEGDAAAAIFGIGPRQVQGSFATPAQLVGSRDLRLGTPDLNPPNPDGRINLRARYRLGLAVDQGSPVTLNLRAGADNPSQVSLVELVTAINTQLGQTIASQSDGRLVLTSPTSGSASSLAIAPLETTEQRRFVTRVAITDEATQTILGFMAREAVGTPETPARVTGTVDLHRGVDLRTAPYLRIQVDDRPPVEVNCALRSPRPRAALPAEIVAAINEQLGQEIASQDGQRLTLTSPSTGPESRLRFELPQAEDLLALLFEQPVSVQGQLATQVKFVGTVDLSAGIDLPAQAAIKLGIDGNPAVNILLTQEPARKTINEIFSAINVALLATIAAQENGRLTLTAPSFGSTSQIRLEVPDGTDVTAALLGVTPPRSYQGSNATAAMVTGKEIANPLDLSQRHELRLSVDGEWKTINGAKLANDLTAVSLDQIAAAINDQFPGVASIVNQRLRLTAPSTGLASRISLAPYTSGDARLLLLGQAIDQVKGTAAAPAVITGEADLLRPVNLRQRRLFRVAVNGNRPVDIDVSGVVPATTSLAEIITAINRVFPGLAAVSSDDRLLLTAPSTPSGSHLAVLPLRYLELIDYPATAAQTTSPPVGHGDSWEISNRGAAAVPAQIEIASLRGAIGPTLVNTEIGWQVRLLTLLGVGETLRLWRDPQQGLQAEIQPVRGPVRPIPGTQILVGPLGAQTWVPFSGTWRLSSDRDDQETLQLNNPLAANLVRLRSRLPQVQGQSLTVAVVEADLQQSTPLTNRWIGRVRWLNGHPVLLDAQSGLIANLRAGAGVDLAPYRDRVVVIRGERYAENPPLLVVQEIACLFDVTLNYQPSQGAAVTETYRSVTIGNDPDDASLVRKLNASSQLVKAEVLEKAMVLTLPQGTSRWFYLDCYGSRYNQVNFGQEPQQTPQFVGQSGQPCVDRGVFNISRFANQPPESVVAVFADSSHLPTVQVTTRWDSHQPGAFKINLPSDLPAQFGGRFNQTRFSQGLDSQKQLQVERYENAVVEPPSDPNYLVTVINAKSALVVATFKPIVRPPLGWEPMQIPFRKPRRLTLGTDTAPACLYLAGEGIEGFIELKANAPGVWGNEIAVAVRKSGPAIYEVSISYKGARFENARSVALGSPLPALVQEGLQPGPVGVLQAKAAGVRATVTRQGC